MHCDSFVPEATIDPEKGIMPGRKDANEKIGLCNAHHASMLRIQRHLDRRIWGRKMK
jgi:hypothetical protein